MCKAENCLKEVKTKGYCKCHYNMYVYKKSPAGLAAKRNYMNRKYKKNLLFKEKTLLRSKQRYEQIKNDPSFKERTKAYSKEWRTKTGYSSKYYEANRERLKAKARQWRIDNPGKARALSARKKYQRELATPKWLTKDQLKQIDNFYINCPPGFHVDHIIPLKGELVCGLHTPDNLQYLSASDNMKKHNKFEPIFSGGLGF